VYEKIMSKLSPTMTKWLKTFHVICACLWGGGAVCLVLLHWAVPTTSGDELFARDLCMKFIDDWVVSSGAVGCLATGVIFSTVGGWGFFKFPWITAKFVMNTGFIGFGAIFFVPWLNKMAHLSDMERIAALEDPIYLQSKFLNEMVAVGMALSLFFLVWLTIFKPWGRREGKHHPKR